MTFTLQRTHTEGDATLGALRYDGAHQGWTLERTAVQIPAGRYPVALTTSQRARDGKLWSPRRDCVLPLVQEVPGRDGIRIHAGNRAEDVDGCIAIGRYLGAPSLGGQIHGSRRALGDLVTIMAAAPGAIWLVVQDIAGEVVC